MKKIITMSAGLLFLWSCPASAEHPSAAEILNRMASAYAAMETYEANGVIVQDMVVNGTSNRMEKSFTIRLGRPNRYRIVWQARSGDLSESFHNGAVWSDGSQPYLYMAAMKAYAPVHGDEFALASATGISGGVAFTIPVLFFPDMIDGHSTGSDLRSPALEGVHEVAGRSCYLIQGSSEVSREERLWIATDTFHLVRYARSMEPPDGGYEMPEFTDEELEDTLIAMGREVNEENMKQMRAMMDSASTSMAQMEITGESVETYAGIRHPDLEDADFVYQLPEGTKRQQSLFDHIPELDMDELLPPL